MPDTRRRAVDGEQRRAQIVDAAQQAIATQGFEGLRVRDIAGQVGINIATLHYYFPTKEALVGAVAARIARTLEPVPPVRHDDARRALVEDVDRILARFEADRSQFVVLNEVYARAGRDGNLYEVLRPSDEAWEAHLRAIFVAGREQGSFRADLDPDGATTLVMGFFKGIVHQMDRPLSDIRRATEEMLRAMTACGPG
ncbi:TetR/AcrR family transcriptional regulator [Herbidospora sp. RD11066]